MVAHAHSLEAVEVVPHIIVRRSSCAVNVVEKFHLPGVVVETSVRPEEPGNCVVPLFNAIRHVRLASPMTSACSEKPRLSVFF